MGRQESPSTARKRKSSTDEPEEGRVVKHRASLACQSCRTRKVRCDVLANGTRCTNCRLDRLECVVLPSRRGKTNRTRNSSNAQTMRTATTQPGNPPVNSDAEVTRHESWAAPSGGAGPVPACVTFDEDGDNVESGRQSVFDEPTHNDTDHARSGSYAALVTPESRTDAFLTPETRTDGLQQHQNPTERAPLPAFIAPLSSRILNEDLEYLVHKGALMVPEPDLQLEILRAYMYSVHPFMPMLDYRSFIHAVLSNRGDGRISLLLFQAVMFAGLHSLELPVLHRLGFESAKQARKVFFNRARLLYEFDVESDSAAVLQSLILMSSWYSKRDERRDTWHWTGLAYDVARRMGLHREPTSRYSSEKVRHFHRRLWWSLYIRDRMIALGTRRPMRIHDSDCDAAILTLEDFDLDPLEESYQEQALMPSAKENKSTALMCIELAKLCTCIGRVVSSQYTTVRTQPDQDIPHTVMIVSRRDEGRAEELESCDKELNEWLQALEINAKRTSSATGEENPHSCSEVHWAILNVAYQTTVNVLHRAQALKPIPESEEARKVQLSSRSKVKESARNLTKLSQTMMRHDQIRFVGLIGVTALIAAYLSHMLDISSADEDVRDASTLRLYQSLEVLHVMRGIYASADAAVSFLASVSRKAGIPVPAQIAPPTIDSTSRPSNGSVVTLTNGRQITTWKDTPGLTFSPDSQTSPQKSAWNINNGQVVARVPDNPLQTHPLLDRDGQILNASSMMQPSPSAASFATPTREQGMLPFNDITVGGFSNSVADGALFDWNSGMDNGIDLESMSFNYDFYSDAFGFVQGCPQGI